MTEHELQTVVARLCRRYDVYFWHLDDPRRSLRGLPDLVLLGSQAACFRELKSASGKLSAEQDEVGQRMLQAGLDWDVWRPSALARGQIDQELAALSGRRPWLALA